MISVFISMIISTLISMIISTLISMVISKLISMAGPLIKVGRIKEAHPILAICHTPILPIYHRHFFRARLFDRVCASANPPEVLKEEVEGECEAHAEEHEPCLEERWLEWLQLARLADPRLLEEHLRGDRAKGASGEPNDKDGGGLDVASIGASHREGQR